MTGTGGFIVDISAGVKVSGTTCPWQGRESAETLAIANDKTSDREKIFDLMETYRRWESECSAQYIF